MLLPRSFMRNVYTTLLCGGDDYIPGAEALGMSLEETGTAVPRVAMVTPDVTQEGRHRLVAAGWKLRDVSPLENPNPSQAQLLPRFHDVFTKLRAWELIDFDRVVFLDSDTIVLQNVDDLFERAGFAAAPDFFLPDRFNSGVMVLKPSLDTLADMAGKLSTAESYDGGDQGFLNTYFADWYAMPVANRLPVGYNMAHFIYQFLHGHPSTRERLEREVKILHFLVQKPWRASSTLTGASQIWWSKFYDAHPDQRRPWRAKLHALEDWTFDHLVEAVVG